MLKKKSWYTFVLHSLEKGNVYCASFGLPGGVIIVSLRLLIYRSAFPGWIQQWLKKTPDDGKTLNIQSLNKICIFEPKLSGRDWWLWGYTTTILKLHTFVVKTTCVLQSNVLQAAKVPRGTKLINRLNVAVKTHVGRNLTAVLFFPSSFS